MTAQKKLKILLAYDGSDRALDSVRYIGDVFPKDRTEVVVFYVETKIPRSFWHMERTLDFRYQTPQIRAAMAERKKKINQTMENARQILTDMGIPEASVELRVHIKIRGIAHDIIEESHQGYNAIVIGRKGHNRFKDFFINTLPMRLLGKIKAIPLIVVGKKPEGKNILIAFDGTREIIKAVKAVSSLISTQGCRLLLCHSQHGKNMLGRDRQHSSDEMEDNMFELPMDYFLEAGFTSDQITFEIVSGEKNPTHCILNKAKYEDYGTIVIGRRALGPLKSLIFRRIGKNIFQNADNHVVWIVQ